MRQRDERVSSSFVNNAAATLPSNIQERIIEEGNVFMLVQHTHTLTHTQRENNVDHIKIVTFTFETMFK